MTETAGEGWHLAQINVALAVDDLDSSALSGFVARIEEINALADDAEGFARLSVAEEYFGLYILVEQIEGTFLRSWFRNNDGILFKGDAPDGEEKQEKAK